MTTTDERTEELVATIKAIAMAPLRAMQSTTASDLRAASAAAEVELKPVVHARRKILALAWYDHRASAWRCLECAAEIVSGSTCGCV